MAVVVATMTGFAAIGAEPAAAAGDDCGTGVDAGNDFTTAQSVTLPVSCSGSTVGLNDVDWYRFSMTAGETFDGWVWTSSTLAPIDACLYDPLGNPVTCGDIDGLTRTFDYTVGATGSWRLRISQGILGGSYSFYAEKTTDCGSGGDAAGSYASALSIALPAWCDGHVGSGADSADWYRFSVTAGQTIWVDLYVPADADFDVCLYSPSNSTVPVSCGVNPTGTNESFQTTASATGSWRARVFRYSPTDSGHYSLVVSV